MTSPTLVLDLDGALVDSVPDPTASLNRVTASRGVGPFTDGELRPMIGDGAAVLLQRAWAARLLDALGLGGDFATAGGSDSFPARKSDPAHLLATLAATGGEPGRAATVGDHMRDALAAIGAGVPCILAAWGYGPPAMAAGAQASACSFPGDAGPSRPAGRRLIPSGRAWPCRPPAPGTRCAPGWARFRP